MYAEVNEMRYAAVYKSYTCERTFGPFDTLEQAIGAADEFARDDSDPKICKRMVSFHEWNTMPGRMLDCGPNYKQPQLPQFCHHNIP